MALETIIIHPFIAKPLHFLLMPWRKYSEFFDKGCWGIWGLSPTLKFTFIYFGLFLVDLFISGLFTKNTQETIEFFFTLGIIALFIVWAVYLPILGIIITRRALKKSYEFGAKTISYLIREPEQTEKTEPTEPSNLELVTRGLKTYWNYYLIKTIWKHIGFLEDITSTYPFSLLFQNRMWHARQKKLRNLIWKIEATASKARLPIQIDEIGIESYFHFYAHFTKTKYYPIKKLEKALQKHFGTIYVRKQGKGIIQINTTIGEEQGKS